MRELIALRHNFLYVADQGKQNPAPLELVMTLTAELLKLGYIPEREAVQALLNSGESSVIKLHDRVLTQLRKLLGADRKYAPIYKNFPTEVMEMSTSELFWNAIVHYWSGGTWEPTSELKDRGIKYEAVQFKTLKLATGDAWLREIAEDLAAFPKPLDEKRVNELVWITEHLPNLELPNITVKETLCLLGAKGFNVKVTNPTDVLRIATHLSGGDISLPGIPKPNAIEADNYRARSRKAEAVEARKAFEFKKFTRPQRKYLLGLLESLKSVDAAELQRYLGRWKRLGEILHPGEYVKQFPKTAAAFHAIRNQRDEKVRTYAGRVDLAFKQGLVEGLAVLQERPGEFARRLDALLRKNSADVVLTSFAAVIDKVSSKVTFELFDHFEARRKDSSRMVMLKGSGSKAKVLEPVPALSSKVVDAAQAMIMGSLSRRMAKLPKLGKVYIDEALGNMPVPYSMQSSSEGVSTYVRGTRVPFKPNAHTLRGFVHWYDENGYIDIDLAGSFYDENFKELGQISFYQLSNRALGACHSGDVRHRKGDCAEYIDVPVGQAVAAGVRYVMFTAYNYNGSSLASVPGATFGVMEREHPNSNEIFDSKTVTNTSKLTTPTSCSSPVVFDLQTREWIWLDIARDTGGVPALYADPAALTQLKAMLNGCKLSVADLLMMHVEARGGELVDTAEEADVAFKGSDFVTNYTKLAPYIAL